MASYSDTGDDTTDTKDTADTEDDTETETKALNIPVNAKTGFSFNVSKLTDEGEESSFGLKSDSEVGFSDNLFLKILIKQPFFNINKNLSAGKDVEDETQRIDFSSHFSLALKDFSAEVIDLACVKELDIINKGTSLLDFDIPEIEIKIPMFSFGSSDTEDEDVAETAEESVIE